MSNSVQNKPMGEPYHITPMEDELDHDPGSYFLSPASDEYDFDEDSDDGDAVEWNAGIDDFALYTEETKTGSEGKSRERWQRLERSQHEALQRALARAQADPASTTETKPPAADDVPSLTPDHSPRLSDNMEMGNPVRGYITVIVTPPEEDQRDYDDLLFMRSTHPKPTKHAVERPGLRYTRTLSGKRHSWTPPDWDLYTVVDEPEAEELAESVNSQTNGLNSDGEAELDEEEVDGDADADSLVSDPDKVFDEVDGVRFEMMRRSWARDVYEEGE